ncbi:hypothetical protein ACJX0J_028712, partial [Zea mays]
MEQEMKGMWDTVRNKQTKYKYYFIKNGLWIKNSKQSQSFVAIFLSFNFGNLSQLFMNLSVCLALILLIIKFAATEHEISSDWVIVLVIDWHFGLAQHQDWGKLKYGLLMKKVISHFHLCKHNTNMSLPTLVNEDDPQRWYIFSFHNLNVLDNLAWICKLVFRWMILTKKRPGFLLQTKYKYQSF